MTLLFDTSPDEPVKKRGTKRAPQDARDQQTAQEPQKTSYFTGKPRGTIGRIDGHYQCADDACGASALDIIDEHRGSWTLECCFCGTLTTEPAILGHLTPRENEFVFHDGRFEGKTVSEAWESPRGRDYVEWAAKSHHRPSVRAACQKHLDSIQPAG